MSEGGFDVEAYRRQQMGQDPDKALLVSFEWRAKSKGADFENVPYIRIWMGKDAEVVRPVTDEDKHRFADRWEAFQRNEQVPEDGTPIALLPFSMPANVAACKNERIYTAEQLVEMPDERLQKAHLVTFKYTCRDWLEARSRNGKLQEMRQEIESLKAQLEVYKERFRTAGLEEPAKPVTKKRRGRPRKNAQDTVANSQ